MVLGVAGAMLGGAVLGGLSGAMSEDPEDPRNSFYLLPEDIQNKILGSISSAKKLSDTPFQEYTGDRLADFTRDEITGMRALRENFGELPNQMQGLSSNFADLYQRQLTGPTQETLDSYMNPYMDNVIQDQIRDVVRNADTQRQRFRDSAISRDAFGGSGRAIQEALMSDRLNETISDISNRGNLQAFDYAMNQNRQGLSGAMSALQGQGNAVGQTQKLLSSDINNLMNSGATQRGLEQQERDFEFSEFARELEDPFTKQQFLTNTLGGLSTFFGGQYQPATKQSTFSKALSGAIGGGMAGYSMGSSFGGMGGGNPTPAQAMSSSPMTGRYGIGYNAQNNAYSSLASPGFFNAKKGGLVPGMRRLYSNGGLVKKGKSYAEGGSVGLDQLKTLANMIGNKQRKAFAPDNVTKVVRNTGSDLYDLLDISPSLTRLNRAVHKADKAISAPINRGLSVAQGMGRLLGDKTVDALDVSPTLRKVGRGLSEYAENNSPEGLYKGPLPTVPMGTLDDSILSNIGKGSWNSIAGLFNLPATLIGKTHEGVAKGIDELTKTKRERLAEREAEQKGVTESTSSIDLDDAVMGVEPAPSSMPSSKNPSTLPSLQGQGSTGRVSQGGGDDLSNLARQLFKQTQEPSVSTGGERTQDPKGPNESLLAAGLAILGSSGEGLSTALARGGEAYMNTKNREEAIRMKKQQFESDLKQRRLATQLQALHALRSLSGGGVDPVDIARIQKLQADTRLSNMKANRGGLSPNDTSRLINTLRELEQAEQLGIGSPALSASREKILKTLNIPEG